MTGRLDESGQTNDYFSDAQKEFEVLVGYSSDEWMSDDDDLNFNDIDQIDI